MRTYVAVEDIQQAMPPTRLGYQGTFAIVIQCDVEHGLWQR